VRGPVEGAEERARGDDGVSSGERAGTNTRRDERAHAAFVGVALGNDARAKAWRERVDLEVCRRALDLVQQAEDVRGRQIAKASGQRSPTAPGRGERDQQPIRGPVLAEEEQFVLPAEVVVQVAGRQVGGNPDVAHAGRREAALAKHARRRAHDVHLARFRPS
jgi:hypothetical protein